MDNRLKSNIKLVLFIFSIILCIWVLKILFPVISLIIVALLIVYLVSPLVGLLVKLKFPQPLAATLVFILFILFILLIFYFIPPLIFREIRQLAGYLATDFRQYILMLFRQLEEIDLLYDLSLSQTIINTIISFIEGLPLYLLRWINRISAFRIPFLSEIWSLVGLFFMIFFFLLDIEKVKATIVSLFPDKYRPEVVHVIEIIDAKVGAYLRGNVIRCSIVGFSTGIGLSIMGMPFAFTLGIVAGILNIIPNIGPLLAAILAILISLTPDTPHPFMVTGLYLVIQTIDPFILTPYLLGKAVDLRPITVIIALLCGARLMGILGIILSIPVTAVLKVLFNHYIIRKNEIQIIQETSIKPASAGEQSPLQGTLPTNPCQENPAGEELRKAPQPQHWKG